MPLPLLKQRYQIVRKIGQGGFGAVYLAHDIQLQSAPRAVKEMSELQLSIQERQEAVEAFKQEAALLAQLMHHHLPRIYDHFEEQQHWYLIMDFIEGQTLDQLLAHTSGGKLPIDKVIQYALQLCDVLKYLHTHVPAIIFRDLKPANIMVTSDDHLYLIDFGIARFFKAGKTKDTIALGSPGYAAPEQYGKEQTTVQADIYGLGATLHHLLSGRDPSNDPFVFPPLQLTPANPMTQALADLITQMVSIEKSKRPAGIQAVKQALINLPPAVMHIPPSSPGQPPTIKKPVPLTIKQNLPVAATRKPAKRLRSLTRLLIVLLILVIGSASLFGGYQIYSHQITSDATATARALKYPSYLPEHGHLELYDSLQSGLFDPLSHSAFKNGGTSCSLSSDGYHIFANRGFSSDTSYTSYQDGNPILCGENEYDGSFAIVVQMKLINGGCAGVAVASISTQTDDGIQMSNYDRYYALEICHDGTYALVDSLQNTNNNINPLSSSSTTYTYSTEQLTSGSSNMKLNLQQTYTLAVVRIASTVSLFINGHNIVNEDLSNIIDSKLSNYYGSYQVPDYQGLSAYYNGNPTEVVFSQVSYWSLS